jgi:hypothetical protein
LLRAKPFRREIDFSEKSYITSQNGSDSKSIQELNIDLMMRKTWNATLQKNQNCIAKKINGARNLRIVGRKKSIDEIATIRVLTNKPFIRIL